MAQVQRPSALSKLSTTTQAGGRGPKDRRNIHDPAASLLTDSNLLLAWLTKLTSTEFFVPCVEHSHLKKNERIFYCMTCGDGKSMCRHCLKGHEGHYVIQMRRYVYNDVINLSEISLYADTSGIQSYSINAAPVIFLKKRPHNHDTKHSSKDSCLVCRRSLKEGHSWCSLECKVENAGTCGSGAAQALLPQQPDLSHLPKVTTTAPVAKKKPQQSAVATMTTEVKGSGEEVVRERKRQRSASPVLPEEGSDREEDCSSDCSAQTEQKRSCSRGRSPSYTSRRKQLNPRQSPPI
eukprot:CAMPEP_0177771480 /NCGR_PEP_ID=MMETSP0491_2-20121128/11620_1 /TAXON_ID=63592 /ORGANISM="Tetraselmis chuii, Strain PLY429" /LENGTH=292 /DNA_ID=CAMNT_0019289043 /DNA_START=399 /DNA_END=1277 /DNA_ORIENTATION=+